jgi:hypothetical protein
LGALPATGDKAVQQTQAEQEGGVIYKGLECHEPLPEEKLLEPQRGRRWSGDFLGTVEKVNFNPRRYL